MLKKLVSSFFCIFIITTAAFSCLALEIGDRYYSLSTGWILHNNEFYLKTITSTPKHFESTKVTLDGFGLSLAYGLHLEHSWLCELEVGYRNLVSIESTIQMELKQWTAGLNLYYHRPVFSVFDAYIGGGLGVSGTLGTGNYIAFYNNQTGVVVGSYDSPLQNRLMGQFRAGGSMQMASALVLYAGYQLMVSEELLPWIVNVKACVNSQPAECPSSVSVGGIKIFSHAIESGLRYLF